MPTEPIRCIQKVLRDGEYFLEFGRMLSRTDASKSKGVLERMYYNEDSQFGWRLWRLEGVHLRRRTVQREMLLSRRLLRR